MQSNRPDSPHGTLGMYQKEKDETLQGRTTGEIPKTTSVLEDARVMGGVMGTHGVPMPMMNQNIFNSGPVVVPQTRPFMMPPLAVSQRPIPSGMAMFGGVPMFPPPMGPPMFSHPPPMMPPNQLGGPMGGRPPMGFPMCGGMMPTMLPPRMMMAPSIVPAPMGALGPYDVAPPSGGMFHSAQMRAPPQIFPQVVGDQSLFPVVSQGSSPNKASQPEEVKHSRPVSALPLTRTQPQPTAMPPQPPQPIFQPPPLCGMLPPPVPIQRPPSVLPATGIVPGTKVVLSIGHIQYYYYDLGRSFGMEYIYINIHNIHMHIYKYVSVRIHMYHILIIHY
eukprot:GHVR01093430.1.p1 GENE.GHVR01093430.1~~GHVR01093430.1.p1  ORF type:complete len:333 (-),score=43.23 GHVR01093430.1:330-1328(-)